MSRFTESQRQTIYASQDIINGRKHFGEYDDIVDSGSLTVEFGANQSAANLSVTIAVLERENRFFETFNRLRKAIKQADTASEVIIIDNSLESNLLQMLQDQKELTQEALLHIVYHHEPKLILPTAWSKAYQELSAKGEYFSIWDSDIYCGEHTVLRLFDIWSKYPDIDGLAPTLGAYNGESIEDAISLYSDIRTNSDTRKSTHMPSPIGEETGNWRGWDILETTIMRGAYVVKRTFLEEVGQKMPLNEPWNRDFACWQNVPLFLTAKEMGKNFGYAIHEQTVVVHDDRIDNYSMGYRISYGKIETIKEICQLMYRNNVFTPEGRLLNSNFLRYNIPAIKRVIGCSDITALAVQEMMLNIAEIFNYAASGEQLKSAFNEISKQYTDDLFQLGSVVVAKLSLDEVFHRVKLLRSLEPSREMYT